jgi:hypothetical protein
MPSHEPKTNDPIEEELRGDSSKEIIAYLSKEIETTTNTMMVFRSKIAFAVFFGPFLILGSFVVAAKSLPLSIELDLYGKIAIAVGCTCFLALAVISARIEKDAANQCNLWRKLIADIHENPQTTIQGRAHWKQNKLTWTYFGAYCLLLASFISIIFISSRVKTDQTPSLRHPVTSPTPTPTPKE